jgi:hypothetical protein
MKKALICLGGAMLMLVVSAAWIAVATLPFTVFHWSKEGVTAWFFACVTVTIAFGLYMEDANE